MRENESESHYINYEVGPSNGKLVFDIKFKFALFLTLAKFQNQLKIQYTKVV